MAKCIILQCKQCSQDFHVPAYMARTRKFCSHPCFVLWATVNKAYHRPTDARFWGKVDKTPGHGPQGDCWLWTGRLEAYGYGLFYDQHQTLRAHVVSYKMHCGDVPKGLCVCHSCDVRHCVRPGHLWLGDNRANSMDRDAKGRNKHQIGEDHHSAKLSGKDVLEILKDQRSQSQIAAQYGIAQSYVSHIKTRKAWKHLTP